MALPTVDRSKRTITLPKGGTGPWFEEQVRNFATEVLLQENREQAKLNPPSFPTVAKVGTRGYQLSETESKALVNLRAQNVRFQGKWRKISLLYGAQADLFNATQAIYYEMLKLTRLKTGAGWNSYYFWLSNKDTKTGVKVNSIPAVKAWLQANQGARTGVAIIGPTVVYRRKLIYNPRGQAGFSKGEARSLKKRTTATSSKLGRTSLDRIVGYGESEAKGFRVRVAGKKRPREVLEFDLRQALQRIAIRRTKAKFPAVWFGYGFVPSKEALPPDPGTGKKYGQGPGPYGNVPIVYIGASLRRR